MTNTKKICLIVLSCLLVVALGLSFVPFAPNLVSAEEIAVTNYFSSSENISVAANALDTRGNNGVSVTLSGIGKNTKASFDYNNYIDVSSLSKGFLEMSFMPTGVGKDATDNDFTIVTLTDAMDETHKLVYVVVSQPASSGWWNPYVTAWISFVDDLTSGVSSAYNSAPIMKIAGTNQTIHAKNDIVNSSNKAWYGEYMDSGKMLGNKKDFTAKENSNSTLNSFKFVLDGNFANINGITVADISNKDFLYYSSRYLVDTSYYSRYTEDYVNNLFPSGYCKLSVEYQGINSDSITCHIKNIGGQNFADNAGCTVNGASPMFSVDVYENGVVGEKYAIPQPYVHDMIDGDLSNRTLVKILDESNNVVHVGYESYAFASAEKHTIQYSVTNNRGVTFIKEYQIKCYEESPLTSFGFTTQYQDSYIVGDSIAIPATNVENSIAINGAVDIDVLIQKDGRIIDVFTNEVGKTYVLSQPGKYSLIFRYTNTYGVTNSQVRNFTVVAGIQYQNDVPVSLVAGKENVLDDFGIINNYNDVAENDIYRAIFINGTNVYTAKGDSVVSGSLTTPASLLTESGTATVEYKVSFDGSIFELAQSHTVPVIKPKYIGDYLIQYNAQGVYSSEGITITNQKSSTAYETTADGGFMLPQAISQDSLSFIFNVRDGKLDFAHLNIVLTNVANRSQKITFSLAKDNEMQSQLTVLGVKNAVSGSLISSTNNFDWTWNAKSATMCNASGTAISPVISTWDNGEKFSGFDKGAILSFEFVGVGTNGAGLELVRVSNQPFVSTISSATGKVQPAQDAFAPHIELSQEYGVLRQEYGSTFTVYSAKEYDILDDNTTLFVTLTAPDGTVILNKASCDLNYEMLINQYGTWSLVYTAYDSTDLIRATKRYNIQVTDTQAPTITISNTPQELYAVGQKIEFGNVYAFDNITQNCVVTIFVVEPDSERNVVTDSYTFTEVGTYRIIYFAQDEAGNYSMISYNVKVSGGLK